MRVLLSLFLVGVVPFASCAGDPPERSHEHDLLYADDHKVEKDDGLPGPFPLPTREGYFLEVAGIEEETPECHPFHGNDNTCAAATNIPAGDIWEQCDKNGYLIETGPGFTAKDFPCHKHKKDKPTDPSAVGHPIRVDCAEYCEDRYGDPGTDGPTYTGWCATTKKMCGGAMQDIGYCECDVVVATPCTATPGAIGCEEAPTL
jgi:hypothetical protein